MKEIIEIPIEKLKPNPYNLRRFFNQEKIIELSQSIKTSGIIQPLVVRKKENYYEIVAGQRRFEACKILNLKTIPCIVKELTDQEVLKFSLIENLQREDISPLEEAKGYKILREKFGFTEEEIGKLIGKSRFHVSNVLSLLKEPEEIQKTISEGKLTLRDVLHVKQIEEPKVKKEIIEKIVKGEIAKEKVKEEVEKYQRRKELIKLIPEVKSKPSPESVFYGLPQERKEKIKIYLPDKFSFFYVLPLDGLRTKTDFSKLPITNFLISAYGALCKESGLRSIFSRIALEELIEKRKQINKLFVDSGMISGHKTKNPDYAYRQNEVIELGKILKCDILSHLDVPMEPKMLKNSKLTPKEALKITIKNAEDFLNAKFDGIKCFNVQGWTLGQYEYCINQFNELGIFDSSNWIGIGTTCMRKPPDLYNVYKFCIEKIRKINSEQHIHAFGIARPEWIIELYKIGINSSDSASPDLATVFNEWITWEGKKIKISKTRTKEMEEAQFIHNSWMFWLLLNEKFKDLIGGKK
jgi:ParB family chromosome partitioning protein